jgi:hypothetical protein
VAVSKADLVPFAPSKEIHGDDTLREMRQVLRFSFINVPGLPLRAQIIFDRVHKQNAAASKPAGFFQISDTGELIKLAKNSIVAATILACGAHSRDRPSLETIRSAVRNALEFATEDIVGQVHVLLDEIEFHRQARLSP